MYNIAVIGGSTAALNYREISIEVGHLLAEKHATVICGGLTGVMEWVAQGVSEAGGTTIGILPGYSTASGNRFLTYRIPTGIGYARNFLIIRAADAVIAIDGATGTMSEAAFALTEGKSVIVIGEFEIDHTKKHDGIMFHAASASEAVNLAFREAEKHRLNQEPP
ncbi:MAG: TIGR00725 family protein, partial [Thermoplasmataceae archaeon]